MKTFTEIICAAFSASLWGVVAAGFVGCAGQGALRTDVEALSIDAKDTEAHAVRVSATASWVVDMAGMVEWLTVRYADTDPNVLWVSAASRNESLEPRSTEITIVSADGLAQTIPVTQGAMDIFLNVSPLELYFFGMSAPTQELTVETDLTSWEAFAIDGSWLTAVRPQDSQNRVVVTVANTRSLDERQDKVVVRPINETYRNLADTVLVRQAGIDLVVMGDVVDGQGKVEIPAVGGEFTFRVYSRHPWTLTWQGRPKSIALSSTSGAGDTENGELVTMTVAANPNETEYQFTLMWLIGTEQVYNYECKQQGI